MIILLITLLLSTLFYPNFYPNKINNSKNDLVLYNLDVSDIYYHQHKFFIVILNSYKRDTTLEEH